MNWRDALAALRKTVDREVLREASVLDARLRNQREVMGEVAWSSTAVADARTNAAMAMVDSARESAEAAQARLDELLSIDVAQVASHQGSNHLKTLRRHLAAVEAAINRISCAENVLQAEIERLEKEKVLVEQLWNHSKRATRFAKRATRRAWWLLRLSPLLHVGFAILALAVAVIADRQTTFVEKLNPKFYTANAHDVAVALVFAIQFYFYEPVASRLSTMLFRRAYVRMLTAGRLAATDVAALITHVHTIDIGVADIAARVRAAASLKER